LKCVYFAHQGLPYGKEDQMLFLDNEFIKALQTLNVVVSSLNFLEDISCQIIRCSGWAKFVFDDDFIEDANSFCQWQSN